MQQALQAARDPAVSRADLDAIADQVEERRAVILPPLPTSTEREQAMATIDQRPDAALRVVRGWLRS
jgi:flagellar M-ring protein FliF